MFFCWIFLFRSYVTQICSACIIYARTKVDVEISASDENFCAYQKIRRPSCASAYYLGSAESPTADFLHVWLKSSLSSDVASRACRPQVIWRLRPLCFYGWRLSRIVPADVRAQLVKISADCQIFCAGLNFHHFLWKIQKSILASKCPITAPKIRTYNTNTNTNTNNLFPPLPTWYNKKHNMNSVRHVTGNDKDYLRKIPRVVW